MKIGVDVRVLLDKHYSGVSSFTFNLLKSILKIDQESKYIFFYNSFKKARSIDFSVEIKKTTYPNKFFNYFLQKILKQPKINKILKSPDIFYMPHLNFASFSGCGVITIHDLSFLRYPNFFTCRKNIWHRAINIKSNIKNFSRIIAVSNNTKNDIIELLGVPEEKIKVVYPGLDHLVDNFLPQDYLKTKFSIRQDYILYLGTIEPRKNIIGVIKSYNLLRDSGKNIDLVLAGSWGWKTKEIKRAWQESKYRDNIIFTSYINDSEKALLYSSAKIFLYPSFYEGFGFPPLEAMRYGIPVIASSASSLPEVLGDAAILINPDKPREIADAMKILLENNEARETLISRGRERVSRFTWEKTAQEYLNIFYELREK